MAAGPLGVLGRFFGRTVSEGTGVAMGLAAGEALHPILQELKNEAWTVAASAGISKPLDVMTIAAGLSQGQISENDAKQIAHAAGYADEVLAHAVEIANVGPGVEIAYRLFRRGLIGEPGFRRAVQRIGLEPEWIDDLVALKDIRLTPAEVANAVQQGHMPNDGVLPTIDPTIFYPAGYQQHEAPDEHPPSDVPLTQIDINPYPEAAAHGVDADRLKVLANLSGLPPGPEALLHMWNRNLINESSVNAGIREGHMKTKWAHAYKRMRWAVLSAAEYSEAWLRGWITRDEAIAGGALTGHTPATMHLLYQNRGRPISPTQALTAIVRKAPAPQGQDYPEHAGPFNEDDFELAIRRSNIRTEYVSTLRELMYLYPTLFQLNRLVTSGAINVDTGVRWATNARYAPEVVAALRRSWEESPAVQEDTHVGKAQTQLWTRTHTSYIAAEIGEARARQVLGVLGVNGNPQDRVITLWDRERDLIRRQLTPADIRKAFRKATRNYATGDTWTRDNAIDALVARGYSVTEANDYLDIPIKG